MESDYVCLVASDGSKMYVERECAKLSGTIRSMLESAPADSMPRFPFTQISGPILERVCQYFYYKRKYKDFSPTQETPEFHIEGDSALDLLLAANILDV